MQIIVVLCSTSVFFLDSSLKATFTLKLTLAIVNGERAVPESRPRDADVPARTHVKNVHPKLPLLETLANKKVIRKTKTRSPPNPAGTSCSVSGGFRRRAARSSW